MDGDEINCVNFIISLNLKKKKRKKKKEGAAHFELLPTVSKNLSSTSCF